MGESSPESLRIASQVASLIPDVHHVVTENGTADLYARTIRQRARALIEIAAPEFREGLEREARELKYL